MNALDVARNMSSAVLIAVLLVPHSSRAQEPQEQVMDFTSPRPIVDAISLFEARTGYLVSYEDVELTSDQDIQERPNARVGVQSSLTRKKILMPRPERLAVRYSTDADGYPADPAGLVKMLAESASTPAHTFRLVKLGPTEYDIVPISRRGAAGGVEVIQPALDTKISFPARPRTVTEAVAEICAQINASRSGPRLSLLITQPAMNKTTSRGAANTPARDVLRAVLSDGDPRLKWLMGCDPLGDCFLNVRYVHPLVRATRSPHLQPAPSAASMSSIPFAGH